MNEFNITTYTELLLHPPESALVQNALQQFALDNTLVHWHDFVAEQYLAGELSIVWSQYAESHPELRANIDYQREVNRAIRTSHAEALRQEMHALFPKKAIPPVHVRRSVFLRLTAAAAICLCLIAGVLWQHNTEKVSLAELDAQVPILVVERFATDGEDVQLFASRIAQRVPVKIASANGVYPVTSYAASHAVLRNGAQGLRQTVGATYALGGSITRSGNGLEIEASLVDVMRKKELWKQSFLLDGDVNAFDDFEDDLVIRIAESLKIPLTDEIRERISADMGRNTNAITVFLAGEMLWAERDSQSLTDAIDMFKLSLREDSTSSLARGYLALTHATLAQLGWGDASVHWQRAREEGARTLKEDPDNPEANVVRGYEEMFINKNYDLAETYLLKALQVRPGDAKIHQALAELYLRNGDLSKGREHIQIARWTEPEHRVVRWVETKYLTAFGMLEEAKIANEDLSAMYPDFPYNRNFNWQYYLTKGEYDVAIAAIAPDSDTRYFTALTHLERGDIQAFDKLYPDLTEASRSLLVMRHIQLNEWAEARQLTRLLAAEHAFTILPMAQTADFRMFRKMKNDPGVQDILAEYGIRVHHIPQSGGPEI